MFYRSIGIPIAYHKASRICVLCEVKTSSPRFYLNVFFKQIEPAHTLWLKIKLACPTIKG